MHWEVNTFDTQFPFLNVSTLWRCHHQEFFLLKQIVPSKNTMYWHTGSAEMCMKGNLVSNVSDSKCIESWLDELQFASRTGAYSRSQ